METKKNKAAKNQSATKSTTPKNNNRQAAPQDLPAATTATRAKAGRGLSNEGTIASYSDQNRDE